MKKLFFTFLFILAFFIQAISQNVWDNTNSEVQPFLYRMAQKGFIEYNDLIKPINRVSVLNALNILKNNDSILTNIEISELNLFNLSSFVIVELLNHIVFIEDFFGGLDSLFVEVNEVEFGFLIVNLLNIHLNLFPT